MDDSSLSHRKRRQSGTASMEYIVVTFVVITALFVPLPGVGVSILDLVLDSLRAFQSNSVLLLSMP